MAYAAQNDNVQTGGDDATKTWRKPDFGWLKCNVDVAIFSLQGLIEYGCVIKNEQGSLVAAKNGLIIGSFDPFLAEALSCRKALNWIKNLGFRKVIIEIDALNVYDVLVKSNMDLSFADSVLDDCKILAQDLVECTLHL